MNQSNLLKKLFLICLLPAFGTATAQILNGDFNHLLQYRSADIGLPFGTRGQTINFYAVKDVDFQPTYVQPFATVCANFTSANAVVPTNILTTTFTSTDNYKLDLSIRRFRKNTNSGNTCTYTTSATSDVIIATDAFLLDDPRNYPKLNSTFNWSDIQLTKNNGTGFTNYRSYWRYKDGVGINSPLQFGTINPGETKSHTNDNYVLPYGDFAYGPYGYGNAISLTQGFPQTNNFQSSPDVTYSFTLTQSGYITINTDNPTTDFDSYLTLVRRNSNGGLAPYEIVKSDEQGGVTNRKKITAPLCAGDYVIVVEGRDGSAATTGKFLLTVNLQGNNAGSIETGHTIPNPQELIPDYVASVTPANRQLSYTWDKSDNGTSNWQGIPQSDTVAYRLPVTTASAYYRRRANFSCGPFSIVTLITDPAFIRVVNPNGVISGKVTSLNGTTGIKGIEVIAYKNGLSISGSPASFIYRDTTGDQGEYSIQPIYYGRTDVTTKTEFVVKPIKPGHRFDKDSIKTELTNLSPEKTIDKFIDSTGYAITGKTFQECTNCNDANGNIQLQTCPLDSVTISTNVLGVLPVLSGYTLGEYGVYGMVVQNPGAYNLSASFRNHLFTQSPRSIVVTKDTNNVNFKDVTTRVISGKLTAGCNNFIGRAVLEFTDVLPNDSLGNPRTSCFRKRVTTDTFTGNYSITLPARKYKVTVVGFSPTSDVTQQNVIAFFAPAKFERDITERDTTINFVYQRPPVLEVLGLNNDCPGLSGNTVDSAFVVIPQSSIKEFLVKVYQGPKPINGVGCPAADTNLRIITNVQNDDNLETFNPRTVNGVDTIRLKGGIPNTIYPFFKTLTIFYTDVFGRQVQFNKKIVVTGVKSDTGTFTTVSPQIPLMVLHDPPGDNSFSFWEKSKSVETAMRFYSADNVGGNLWTEVKLGTKVQLGLGVSTETSVWGSLNTTLGVTARNANTTEAIVTTTTTENFSTSNNPAVTGANGDVFIGTALNLKYARADEIKYTAPCNLSKVGRMMIANNGFGTKYIYSEGHIKNNIIPTLTEFRDNPGNTAAQIANWQNQINVWQQMLANNDANKRRAIWKENYSFDGNVGTYSNITDTFSTKSSTIEFAMEIDKTIAGELGFEIGGSGLSGGVMVNFKIEEGNSTTNTVTKKTTLGYTLDDDDDEGDYFSVTIKTDPVYNSPVFEMEAGTSSCPHEAGTQPRDDMQLAATKPILTGVNSDTAYFTLQLTNTSQSRETRTYLFSFVQQSNTNATVTIGGSPALPVPIPYTISYGGTVSIDVGVKRNGDVFAYEGLQFQATDECGGGISKTAAISAFFTTACSSIQLASPENNWTNTTFNNNIIPVQIKGYTVANLTTVSLEYSKAGISNWIEGFSRTAAQLVNGVNGTLVNWNVAVLPDGIYNLRLKLTCASGIVYTERVTGIIDRKGPSLLGITQPTDDNYVNGDIIAADYNENIDCNSLTNFNVELKRLSNNQLIEARLGCYQNNIVVVPLTPITSFVGDSMEVTLRSIADLYSNIKPASDSWRFIVGSSVPDVSSRALKLVNNKPSILENSGDSIVYTFKLPVNTPNDVRVNYSISGNSTPAIDYNVVYGQTPTQATSYTGSQGSIIIKGGTNSSTLKVKPIPNTQFAPNKTITLSLAEGGDYLLGDSTTANGTIVNDDTPGSYTFTGNGNFTEVSNWQNGLVPPYNSLISDEIIINPAGNGECIVNVPVRMRAGGKFTVAPGKKLIINGNVRVAN